MRKTFTVRIHGDHNLALQRARRRAARQGIKVVGDETRGSFTGMVSGHYEVLEDRAKVTIVHKPAFYPWALVEKFLQDSLAHPSRRAERRTEDVLVEEKVAQVPAAPESSPAESAVGDRSP